MPLEKGKKERRVWEMFFYIIHHVDIFGFLKYVRV